MVHLSTKNPKNNLLSWSWKEIILVYRHYGTQLAEYERIKKSIHNEWLNRDFNSLSLDAWWFDSAFNRDIQRINAALANLDFEIARRNKLIGVIG